MGAPVSCRDCEREIPDALVPVTAVSDRNGGGHLCDGCTTLRMGRERRRNEDARRREKAGGSGPSFGAPAPRAAIVDGSHR
jgi:hypothetical protein